MDVEHGVCKLVLLLLAVTYTHQAWVVPSPQPNLALYKKVHCESKPCDQALVDGKFNRLPLRINSDMSYSWIDLGKKYRISQIHLYDEISLNQLKIMTSTQVLPGKPTSGVSPGWTNQSVSPAVFPSLRQRNSISWSPFVLARHVALFTYTSAVKEIEIHTVIPQYNLAMGKPASQSSTNGEKVAQKAVNGNWTDFTQTQPGDNSWLKVDLLRNYKIGLIRVLLNPLMDRLTVMYSIVESPSSPSLSSRIWTILRNNTKKTAFIVDVFCVVTARHVAVFTAETFTGLAINEIIVYVPYNLAYGRSAIQGPNSNPVANMAVNSIYSDFTSVRVDSGIKWWCVNLGDKYSLSKVELFRKENSSESLVNITLFTTNVPIPTNLSASYEGWTNRSYQGPPYGAVGVIDFTSPIEAQHVAVVSENIAAPLSLAEVVVYEYNYAKSMRVFCKPNCSPTQPSRLAVDGDFDSYSSFTRNKKWSYFFIDLGKKIVFTSLVLSVKGRHCSSAGNIGRCGHLTFRLAVYTRPQQPTRDWNVFRDGALCMPLTTVVSNNIIVKCERFYFNPVARSVSVVFEHRGEAIREVEIYGKEVPRLSKDTIDWQVDVRNWSSLHVSFRQWTQVDIGAFPPSGYNITLEDRSESVIIHFHELTPRERVTCSWYDLAPATTYNISVGVLVISVRHTSLLMFTETTACSDPEPQFTTMDDRSFAADGWLYPALNVTLTTTANCLGELYHNVSIFDSKDQLVYRKINTSSHKLFVEKLGNNETYKFILTARNSVQLTKTIEQAVTVKSLAYQDSTQCDMVLVNNSEFSNANETRAMLNHRIYYQCNPGYNIDGDNYLTCWKHKVDGFVMRGSLVCVESNITCPPPPPGGATEDVQRPSTHRTHNDRYTYICREGYFTLERVTITCTGAGNWSSAPPNCIPSFDKSCMSILNFGQW